MTQVIPLEFIGQFPKKGDRIATWGTTWVVESVVTVTLPDGDPLHVAFLRKARAGKRGRLYFARLVKLPGKHGWWMPEPAPAIS